MSEKTARVEQIENGYIVTREYEVKTGKGKNAVTDWKSEKKYFKNAKQAGAHIEKALSGKKGKKKSSSPLVREISGA